MSDELVNEVDGDKLLIPDLNRKENFDPAQRLGDGQSCLWVEDGTLWFGTKEDGSIVRKKLKPDVE